MADIAFLLLIFFLVTTTMDTDIVIERHLPAKDQGDPPPAPPRDVFEIRLNMNDQILAEGRVMSLAELNELAFDFYLNPNDDPTLPEQELITASLCQDNIQKFQNDAALVKSWRQRLLAVEYFGPYYRLPSYAAITLSTDDETNYAFYLSVQNEIQSVVNELRDEWSVKYFGRPYTELDEIHPEDQQKIMAIRQVYPQIISEIPNPNSIADH